MVTELWMDLNAISRSKSVIISLLWTPQKLVLIFMINSFTKHDLTNQWIRPHPSFFSFWKLLIFFFWCAWNEFEFESRISQLEIIVSGLKCPCRCKWERAHHVSGNKWAEGMVHHYAWSDSCSASALVTWPSSGLHLDSMSTWHTLGLPWPVHQEDFSITIVFIKCGILCNYQKGCWVTTVFISY